MDREVLLPEERSGDQTSSHTKPGAPSPKASDPSEARQHLRMRAPGCSLFLTGEWPGQSQQGKWRPDFPRLAVRTIQTGRAASLWSGPGDSWAWQSKAMCGGGWGWGVGCLWQPERLCYIYSHAWGLAPPCEENWVGQSSLKTTCSHLVGMWEVSSMQGVIEGGSTSGKSLRKGSGLRGWDGKSLLESNSGTAWFKLLGTEK